MCGETERSALILQKDALYLDPSGGRSQGLQSGFNMPRSKRSAYNSQRGITNEKCLKRTAPDVPLLAIHTALPADAL